MLKLLAVLLCAVAVYAQIPQPCFSPPLLTFRADQYNHEFTTFRHFISEYDDQQERIAFYEMEEEGPHPGRQYFHLIFLHKQNISYEYNRQTKVCHKGGTGPFHQFGVPSNARYEGQYVIGGPGETVDAVEWSDRSDVSRENWLGVFSRINCYPIRTWLHDERNNESVTTHIFNLTTGISDPNMFNPEPECQNATYATLSPLARSLMTMYRGTFY